MSTKLTLPDPSVTPYLTTAEAAVYLRRGSVSAVLRLKREHRLPFLRQGRTLLFHRGELDAWLKGQASA